MDLIHSKDVRCKGVGQGMVYRVTFSIQLAIYASYVGPLILEGTSKTRKHGLVVISLQSSKTAPQI